MQKGYSSFTYLLSFIVFVISGIIVYYSLRKITKDYNSSENSVNIIFIILLILGIVVMYFTLKKLSVIYKYEEQTLGTSYSISMIVTVLILVICVFFISWKEQKVCL